MHHKLKASPLGRIIPIVLILAVASGAWWVLSRSAAAADAPLAASGTFEAVTVNISPELGGRVASVMAAEGESVTAGQVLVEFDASLLRAQRAQAEAGLAAAEAALSAARAGAAAAQANHALLLAGPSAEQLAVAQSVVDRAQVAADGAADAYDALPDAARDSPDGLALQQQVDLAEASFANAQAQYDLAAAGARPEQLAAAQASLASAEAQRDAAGAQVRSAQAALAGLDVQIGRLTLVSPIDGVVLARAIQPGEVASPGAVLLVIGQLSNLTLTVFVPEDRYGAIQIGQAAAVSVDSFPDQTFTASVVRIADQAEFTPRNVQTAAGRRSTVYAIRLSLANNDGLLKPGMPADVSFEE